MKPASTDLRNLLATRQFNHGGLYHFALADGGDLYYTSADTDILFDGHTYSAGGTVGPYLDRTENKAKAHWKVGVEVDTLSFDVMPGSAAINGQPFLSAVREGVFDGADLTFSHAYWPQQAWQTPIIPTGTVIMFAGRVAEIDAGRSLATFAVNSHLELLNQNLPRNVYQAGCLNTLFDSSCGVDKADFAVSGAVTAGNSTGNIYTNLTQADNYFALGTITFTSGANAGISRSLSAYKNADGLVTVWTPWPSIPAIGDTFTILPGCDKMQATCALKFNNLANFRGFPFVPSNETAV